MKIECNGQYHFTIDYLMRRCGYGKQVNGNRDEPSYTRSFGRLPYPHFHAYVKLTDDGFVINLHLDQKKPSYGEAHAHNGEYDGSVVEAEAGRITQRLNTMKKTA